MPRIVAALLKGHRTRFRTIVTEADALIGQTSYFYHPVRPRQGFGFWSGEAGSGWRRCERVDDAQSHKRRILGFSLLNARWWRNSFRQHALGKLPERTKAPGPLDVLGLCESNETYRQCLPPFDVLPY